MCFLSGEAATDPSDHEEAALVVNGIGGVLCFDGLLFLNMSHAMFV